MNRPRWTRLRESTAVSSQAPVLRGGAKGAPVEQDADGDYDKDGVTRDCPACDGGLKADGSQCPTCKGAGVLNGPVRESDQVKRLEGLLAATTNRLREAAPESLASTFAPMSTATTDSGAKGYEVVLIREGLGNSGDGRWYTRHAIEELAASGVCEGMQAYADHPSLDEEEFLPERSIRDMVGSYHSVRLAESGGKAELRGTFVPIKGNGYDWVTTLAENAVGNQTGQPLVGISLYGAAAGDDRTRPDGSFGPMADLIRPTSGDVVTNAGAGGKFVRRLMESARSKRAARDNEPKGGAMKLTELKGKMKESAKKLREAGTDEARTAAVDELDLLAEAQVDVPEPDLSGLTEDKLKESNPALVATMRESAKAEVKPVTPAGGTPDEKDAKITELEGKLAESDKKAGDLDGKLRESEKKVAVMDITLLGTKVMREAKVPVEEAEYYLSKFREASARDEDAMKAIITAEQEREQRVIARVRESAGLDGLGFVEGMPGRTDDDTGMLELDGVPMVDPAETEKDKQAAAA